MALCHIIGATAAILDKTLIAVLAAIILIILWTVCLPKKLCKIWHITILIFILTGFVSAKSHTNPTAFSKILSDNPKGVNSSVTGTVVKIRSKESGKEITIDKCTVMADEKFSVQKLLIYANDNLQECHEGDVIEARGKISAFQNPMNKGEFNPAVYYASLNIDAKLTAKEMHVVKKNTNRLLTAIFDIKDKMQKSFLMILPKEDAGVLMSMILGDKAELDSSINTLYQRSGIAHILAISGLHISLIGMTLYKFLRKLGIRFAESAVLSSVLIICYGIMTGNAVSAVRAFVMFAVNVFAQVLGRKYDMLTAASLAALLILFDMPLMLTNSGFLLSFGAVIGIVRIYPVFEKILPKQEKNASLGKRVIKWIYSSLAVSVSISLTTVPVLLCSFYEFPLWSIVLNLIVIPLMGLVMACGFIGGTLGIVWQYAGRFIIGAVHYILILFKMLCNISDSAVFGRIITGIPDVRKIILYYCILAAFAVSPYLLKSKKKLISFVLPCIALMAAVMLFNPVRELEAGMLYVGQGDGIYVRIPNGTNMLFDGGSSDKKELGKYTLSPCLKAHGIAVLDYIFISHTDEDHYNGAAYLLENQSESGICVKTLVMPDISQKDEAYDRLVAAALQNGTKVITAGRGTQFSAMEGKFKLECLAPAKGATFSGKNASSAVYKMSYGNFDMLFTGDIEEDGEKQLINSGVLSKCEVLKVSHHGSDNSTPETFLDEVNPSIALISCGMDNRYKHPGKKLLARLDNAKAQVYVTAEYGEIRIRSDGSSYRIMTWQKVW